MDIQGLINSYITWLKSEITFKQIGEYYKITTPYLDTANDYLEIYVKQEKDNIFFSDDGYIINNLEMRGIKLTGKCKKHIERILCQYNIELKGDELITKSPIGLFAQKKHLFIQALLRIDDIFSITKNKTASSFIEEIQSFFSKKEIYYSNNVQFTGKSGFLHSYDFLFQKTKNKPERLCVGLNNPSRSNMGNTIFAWNDTKPVRNKDSQLIVILNDSNNITKGVKEAFLEYETNVILWSERNKQSNLDLIA